MQGHAQGWFRLELLPLLGLTAPVATCVDTTGEGDFNVLEDVEARVVVIVCVDTTLKGDFDGTLEDVAARKPVDVDTGIRPSRDPNEKLVAVVLKGLDPER